LACCSFWKSQSIGQGRGGRSGLTVASTAEIRALHGIHRRVTISFERKDIREVMKQVSEVKGVVFPFEVPDGTFLVEKSEVTGMPTDDFLGRVAGACGLVLQYAPDKLVFVKAEKQGAP